MRVFGIYSTLSSFMPGKDDERMPRGPLTEVVRWLRRKFPRILFRVGTGDEIERLSRTTWDPDFTLGDGKAVVCEMVKDPECLYAFGDVDLLVFYGGQCHGCVYDDPPLAEEFVALRDVRIRCAACDGTVERGRKCSECTTFYCLNVSCWPSSCLRCDARLCTNWVER